MLWAIITHALNSVGKWINTQFLFLAEVVTSQAVLEEKIPAEQRPLIFHGMLQSWKSFRDKCKGTNFNVCLWFAKLRANPHDNLYALSCLSRENRVSALKSLRQTHNSARDRVRTSLNIGASVLLQMCPQSLCSQPSDCTPFHLTVIACFSTLKENGSRKTKGQRKEINMGMMPSFAVCDLVYKGMKPAYVLSFIHCVFNSVQASTI